MPNIIVRADGAYLQFEGREIHLPGLSRVTAAGGVVVRFPPRDVNVIEPLDPGSMLDCSDLQMCISAVVQGGITLQQIAAIRPGMAAAVQTYMQNHGMTAGSAD